ncbi:branched-chain amino acid aminotransferase II [Coccomyxa subellipsoidea C-169]|uniref:Branched-chain-amino-acid aminotransferase n=1 Tax=Coccomyxa subellipsoidea (strain C-169) TaxID=574566 RepID=I0YYU4_COCSC|nr:branched-chain amino acid aminotransferase II [Coccomyxa subellipsoidea C-169]EIE23563.1 branched-chain amino acid aminotransferase II [Coccomyxa subellipsoidea C-169]|eukprot:XP_005648107.1 branched-chain amino acid aminotransferase II [Coccomyxa subellipsoidea C-169]
MPELKFGQVFTDHLFIVEHAEGAGWGRPQIRPFSQGITVHPAAQVLHYGMCCFEGMKAYLGVDGRGRLFRPDLNMQRMYRSSRRLMLADYDPGELLECLKELLRVDHQWLPEREGYSLYVRPFMFSSAHTLGVGRPTRSTIAITLSPVGPYFATGLTPIQLFLSEEHVRAWPGGVGDCKVGSNYAPTILPQAEAQRKHGTPQVLYTLPSIDGSDPESAVISESGAMNCFFLLDKADGSGLELTTPPLDGTILPGVTRDSILALARAWNDIEVAERYLTIREIKQASEEGRLREIFGCGTACIVQPVNALIRANGDVIAAPFDASSTSSMTARMTHALTDIQVPSDWSVPFDDAKIADKELFRAEA